MIFHRIFRFTYFLIFCIWGVQSCTKDDLIETPADTDSETTENPYGIIRIAEKDLTPDVFKLMLQDDEPATILFNNTQRGFRVNQPLQVSITEQQELFIRFYSPRPVKEVTVWATISGYDEAFQLAKFDVLPSFTEFADADAKQALHHPFRKRNPDYGKSTPVRSRLQTGNRM